MIPGVWTLILVYILNGSVPGRVQIDGYKTAENCVEQGKAARASTRNLTVEFICVGRNGRAE